MTATVWRLSVWVAMSSIRYFRTTVNPSRTRMTTLSRTMNGMATSNWMTLLPTS